jgi:hypothetical protein
MSKTIRPDEPPGLAPAGGATPAGTRDPSPRRAIDVETSDDQPRIGFNAAAHFASSGSSSFADST